MNIDKNEKIKSKTHLLHRRKEGIRQETQTRDEEDARGKQAVQPFQKQKFLPEEYEKDKGLIIDKYNEWGYRDAIINTDSVVPYDKKHVDIYINIDEGNKYYLRNVEWVGNSVYSSESLAQALKMKRGDVYNQKFLNKRLVEDEDAIGNQYYNNGYVFYNLNPVEVNIDGDSVDLEMRIYEGQQATLNNIRISGNTRVYENVIRRELHKARRPFQEGRNHAFYPRTGQHAVLRPGKIEPDIKPDQENGTVDINYKLEPKASDQVQLSFGWGQTGIVGTVGLKFTNFSMQNLFSSKNRRALFPQGDGQQLSLNAQTNAKYYQSYSFNFLDPWFGGKRPNQLSFSIFYSKQTDVNSDYYNSSYYKSYNQYLYGYGMSDYYNGYYNYYDPDTYVKIFGVSLGWGTRLRWPDDFFSLMLEATYMRYMLKSWNYFIISDGNCNNFNIGVTVNRSSIDNNIFPRSGSEFTFSVSATPPYSLWDGKGLHKAGARLPCRKLPKGNAGEIPLGGIPQMETQVPLLYRTYRKDQMPRADGPHRLRTPGTLQQAQEIAFRNIPTWAATVCRDTPQDTPPRQSACAVTKTAASLPRSTMRATHIRASRSSCATRSCSKAPQTSTPWPLPKAATHGTT